MAWRGVPFFEAAAAGGLSVCLCMCAERDKIPPWSRMSTHVCAIRSFEALLRGRLALARSDVIVVVIVFVVQPLLASFVHRRHFLVSLRTFYSRGPLVSSSLLVFFSAAQRARSNYVPKRALVISLSFMAPREARSLSGGP